jgi:uncharacterized membrane protein
MTPDIHEHSSITVAVVFDLLNPIPFGFFVAALIFDAVYAKSADILWVKSAAWLISIGLLFALVPRLINLVRVWFTGPRRSATREKAAFFLYFFGVVAAIFNAFVHSRDAYATIPEGLWLSILTVAFLGIGNVLVTLQHSNDGHKGQR